MNHSARSMQRHRKQAWPRKQPWLRWGMVAGLAMVASGIARAAQPASTAAADTGCGGLGSQLVLVALMLTLSCMVHALVSVLQSELTRRGKLARWCGPHTSGRLLLIVAMALLTALALMVEILLWALLYRSLGIIPSLESSLYFSGVTFTTVGYGDMTLPACWRLLSVGEAVNGVLMAGWSTAQLITVVQRMMELRLQAEGWVRATADPLADAAGAPAEAAATVQARAQPGGRDRGSPGGTTR
jgi:hypothetical protein